jgi:uncharacterized membrane protein (DUF485 family)
VPQPQTSSPDQGQQFDWWAAPAAETTPEPLSVDEPVDVSLRMAVPAQPTHARAESERPTADDQESVLDPDPGPVPAAEPDPLPADRTEVYRAVQASEAFREIRRSYRAFVLPTSVVFVGWFLVYVAAQAAAPTVMRSEVVGPLNVAWVLGLLQFASTFLLTWLYARNSRTKRDRAALGLRWDTQDQLR